MNHIINSLNYLWIGFLLLGVLLSLVVKSKRSSNKSDIQIVTEENLAAAQKLATLQKSNAFIRAGGVGKKGEDLLRERVTSILTELGVKFCTQLHPDRSDAVLLPRGNSSYSKEIDLLLVTEFGVYMFEVKNWAGAWSRSSKAGQLEVTYPNGMTGRREDPLSKTLGKLNDIREKLSGHPVSKAIVVNTSSSGSFDKKLSSEYLHADDLAYFFRSERDRNPVIANFTALRWDVLSQLDGSANAKHDHLMRLSPDTENVREYQLNHERIQQLIRRPKLAYPAPRILRGWVVCALLSFSCAYVVHTLTPPAATSITQANAMSVPTATAVKAVGGKRPRNQISQLRTDVRSAN